MSCRLIWSQHTQRVYHGRSAGRVRTFFLTRSEEQVRGSFLSFAFCFLPISLSLCLVFPSSLPRFLTAARSQSVLPDFHQIGPLRNVFRCTRSGTSRTSARVTPLACAYLLSCGSHRCRHVDTSTGRVVRPAINELSSVACTRLSLWQHPARQSARLPRALSFPSSPNLSLSLLFNRLLRILSLDRANIARETCIYALLSPHDRGRLIHLRTMPLVIRNTIYDWFGNLPSHSYQIGGKQTVSYSPIWFKS